MAEGRRYTMNVRIQFVLLLLLLLLHSDTKQRTAVLPSTADCCKQNWLLCYRETAVDGAGGEGRASFMAKL